MTKHKQARQPLPGPSKELRAALQQSPTEVQYYVKALVAEIKRLHQHIAALECAATAEALRQQEQQKLAAQRISQALDQVGLKPPYNAPNHSAAS